MLIDCCISRGGQFVVRRYRWEFMVILSTVSEKKLNKNRRNYCSCSSKKHTHTCTIVICCFGSSPPNSMWMCSFSALCLLSHTNGVVKLPVIWLFACAFLRIITIVVEWKVINVATIQHVAHFIYRSLSNSSISLQSLFCHNRHHHHHHNHHQRKLIVHMHVCARTYTWR